MVDERLNGYCDFLVKQVQIKCPELEQIDVTIDFPDQEYSFSRSGLAIGKKSATVDCGPALSLFDRFVEAIWFLYPDAGMITVGIGIDDNMCVFKFQRSKGEV